MYYFSDLFSKVLNMIRTGPMSILTTLADVNRTSMTNTYCVYTVLIEILLIMESRPVRNM